MCVRACACIAVACSCFSHAFQCVVRERELCVYKVKKKMREGALCRHCCTPLWVVAFNFYFFLFLYSCLQWPLCTARTWHGDRHCVPLSPLQTNRKRRKKKHRGLLALFASGACRDYFGIRYGGKCAGVSCPMLVRAAGTPWCLVPLACLRGARWRPHNTHACFPVFFL